MPLPMKRFPSASQLPCWTGSSQSKVGAQHAPTGPQAPPSQVVSTPANVPPCISQLVLEVDPHVPFCAQQAPGAPHSSSEQTVSSPL